MAADLKAMSVRFEEMIREKSLLEQALMQEQIASKALKD